MRSLLAALIIISFFSGYAQKTTRGKLKLRDDVRFESSAKVNDTIVPARGDIGLYGYEKAQQSTKETFFVTNRTERTIVSMIFSISYYNVAGEMLHSRTEVVRCDIPPAETRKIGIKSWDSQKLWHYVGSHARHSDFSNPYDIRMRVEYVVSPAL